MSVREMLEQLVPDSGPTYNFGDGPWTCHERPQDYRKRVIDALADGAEIKYRRRYQNGTFSDSFNSDIFSDNDPHSTITLKPQPIRRGVTKAEIVAEIKSWHNVVLDKLAARIEAEGIIE